jgi:Tol biopolymer transport system component
MPGTWVREWAVAFRAVCALLLVAASAYPATLPPRYRFQTLEEGRVRLHFHRDVEGPARRTMSLVLEILPRLEERYRVRVPSLDVVVHDANDAPNGLATSFPYPFVEIRTASFDGSDSGPTESWLRMVVTHELTHIVHIEQAGGVYGFFRHVFGRAPLLFPDALQPGWFIEGLAVREETRGTAFGRGRHTLTRMVTDEAARGGQLAKLDQATLGLDLWPLGNAAYLFGQDFLDFIERKYAEGATRDLAVAHGRSFHPYLDERTFRQVLGTGLTPLWREFAAQRAAGLRPLAPPQRLTTRGVLQTGPRLSPDGRTLAYTSRALDRLGEIRLMEKDGTGDRRLASRLSGTGLAWSRDGKSVVFDETNQVRKFESRSDLHRADVRTGRRTRLTNGLRASDPDLGTSSDGRETIVFVRRFEDRSELSLLRDGEGPRTLTVSPPGTEWSDPRFSPRGDAIVAARLEKGFLDLILVDPGSGAMRSLTSDRAMDVEPSWVDDERIAFRSDREEESFRIFLVNRDGTGLRRLLNSPENAFTPEVDARERTVFYSSYSSRGYDLARAPFEEGEAPAAWADRFPPGTDEPAPFAGPAKSYSPFRGLRPRFISPYVELVSDEWRVGLLTASVDPLLRTAYGVIGSWGTEVRRLNAQGYLRYDRFAPTLTLFGRVESQPSVIGVRDLKEGRVSLDFPLERAVLRSQTVNLTLRRRREGVPSSALDTGVIALGWQFDSTRAYPLSISPSGGFRIRVGATRELESLGSDLDFGKVIVDVRGYARLGRTVLVSRLGGGWTFGPQVPRSAYSVGGLASPALLDPVADQPAVLRGYDSPEVTEPSRFGKTIGFGNLEWRIPLGHPQRGIRALPVFLQHLHLSAALDAAVVSQTTLDLDTARVGASLGLGVDLFLGHRIPVSVQGGVGFGLTRDGSTVPWFSLGFPF